MQADNNDAADRRGSQGSDPGDSGSTSQPLVGSRLRDKLQKFAAWRIDSSSIEFPEDAPEFRGGFATVSQAVLISTPDSESTEDENKSDDRSPMRKAVAVKKLKIEYGKDKERVLGLALREAGFLTELSHGNVIKLEGFVEDLSEDRVWLVFPWAANGNLKDFAASANWEIPERIRLIADVVVGVEYLHRRNPPIYHGDLKSANVLVNSNRRAVVTDFGSARRLTKTDPPVQPEKSENAVQPVLLLETEFCEATNTVTLTGNQFTLRWAAPELLKDDGAGLWSDIWALGWIFYEVVTNSIPFHDVQKDSVVFIRVIQGNLPSVADHTSMVLIRRLYSLMITCWCIDPTKRPTAEDCRKSMSWMPMIVPDPQRASNTSGSRARSPELLVKLGNMHRSQDDYINASQLYTEALGICTDTADNAGKAHALFGLATVHRLQYELSKAVPLYSEVVQICIDTGNRRLRDDALGDLAHVHRLRKEYSEAVSLYSEAVQIFTDIGDRRGKANALWGLAAVHRVQKRFSQAVQLLSEVLQIRIDTGDRNGRAWALWNLAYVRRDQDQHEDAIRLYEEAAGIFEEIGSTLSASNALNDATWSRQKLKPAEAE